MGYDNKSLFECVYCPVCTCLQLPFYRNFTVEENCIFECINDARKMADNLGEIVTSFSPMLQDDTKYHIYLVLCEAKCSLREIKAYAKVMNVNYLQAKRVLTQKRNLIAAGNAHNIWEILGRLEQFDIHYEIEPEYPYK